MPPLAIVAGITAVGTIGGALIGSSAQNKAAKSANASQQAATQAELQLGRENMAQQKDIYNANFGLLSPFVSRGDVAGQSINALLGLPNAPAMTSPLAGAPATTTPAQNRSPLFRDDRAMTTGGALARTALLAARGQNPGRTYTNTPTTPAPTPAPAQPPVNALTANDAFNNFANSAGMQFQLKQGENAINSGYAARGQLQSGAALKALQGYGQQTALQNYFMPYLSLLGGQQSTGAQAGSAVAGVGSNFGNTAAGIYGGMANAIQGGANAASNAALLRGQNNVNMWSSIGGALGGLGSSFFPRGG
jgi:hypothetical protein